MSEPLDITYFIQPDPEPLPAGVTPTRFYFRNAEGEWESVEARTVRDDEGNGWVDFAVPGGSS